MGSLKKHTIKASDTLQSLATDFLGNPEKWYEIAIYNNLTYPFITTDPTWRNVKKATGQVRFFRTDTSSLVEIPVGTRVYSKEAKIFGYDEYQKRVYITLQPAVLEISKSEIFVLVEALESGENYNISEKLIESYDSPVAGVNIENTEPINGGETVNVKKPGDLIIIPTAIQRTDPIIENIEINVQKEALGIDMFLADFTTRWDVKITDNDLQFDFIADDKEDIQVVEGVDNFKQAIMARLITERGELERHPNYGCQVMKMAGRPATPALLKLIEFEIAATIRSDPRTIDIENLRIERQVDKNDNTGYFATCDIIMIGRDEPIPFDFLVRRVI